MNSTFLFRVSIPLTAGSGAIWNTAKFCFPELAYKIYIFHKPRTLSSRGAITLDLETWWM